MSGKPRGPRPVEVRAKIGEQQRRRAATPEAKARRSAASKALWADPEYRAKLAVSRKAAAAKLWQDPEHRAKMLASFAAARERRQAREAATIEAQFQAAHRRIREDWRPEAA